MSLTGKTILVTGVSSGIGKAIAEYLIVAGASVIGADRNAPADGIKLTNFHHIDLADPEKINAVVDGLSVKLDGVANVAGASSATPIEVQFRVNFLGTRHLTNRLTPLLASKASVVNVAAGAGMFWRDRFDILSELLATTDFEGGLKWLEAHPQDKLHSYARSKEAQIFWTLKTAVEWVGSGKRINAVSPGPVETPMLNEFREIIGKDVIDSDAKRSGRAATAKDIAPVVAFLLSDESEWIHGANIPADGGFSASALTSKENWAY